MPEAEADERPTRCSERTSGGHEDGPGGTRRRAPPRTPPRGRRRAPPRAHPARRRRSPRPPRSEPEAREEELASGVLDILANGSGFVRVDPAGQSRDDVYVSPAQIRRCELRAGDVVSGPLRPPRRNERHPSLIRVATVNGADAEPPEERPWFGDLTAVFPSARLDGPPRCASLPFGRGSRVAVAGPPGAGASTLLHELAAALAEAGRHRRPGRARRRAARGGRRMARRRARRGAAAASSARPTPRHRQPSWRSSAPSARSSAAATRRSSSTRSPRSRGALSAACSAPRGPPRRAARSR